jgi:hypothetical protein
MFVKFYNIKNGRVWFQNIPEPLPPVWYIPDKKQININISPSSDIDSFPNDIKCNTYYLKKREDMNGDVKAVYISEEKEMKKLSIFEKDLAKAVKILKPYIDVGAIALATDCENLKVAYGVDLEECNDQTP